MRKVLGFVGATILLSVFLLVIFLSGCKKDEIQLSDANKSLSGNKLKSAPSTNIKVLFVGMSGGTSEPINSGFSSSFASAISSRAYIDITEAVYHVEGNTNHSGHNHLTADFFKQPNGTPYDVVIITGADGTATACKYHINDVMYMRQASDGTNGRVPQAHKRCSHLYKWDTQNPAQAVNEYGAPWSPTNVGYDYRELLGAYSMDHDYGSSDCYAHFQNTGDPCLSNLDVSNFTLANGGMSGLYYNTIDVSYNNSLKVLVDVSRTDNMSYSCWCNIGAQNNVPVIWNYLYKGSVRMISDTWYSNTDRMQNSEYFDIYARALIWLASKDNATYLKGGGGGGGSYTTIPAKIEAEAYTSMYGVQLENTTDAGGGQNVGYIDNNDWMNYNIHVNSAGTFNVDLRVASQPGGGSLQLKSGSNVLATVTVPNTGGWQVWTTVNSGNISLPAGDQVIQVYATGAGWNFNWLQFNGGGGGPSTPSVSTTTPSSITQNTASSGGNVTADGGASVSARGLCWSTTANPTTSNSTTSDGSGTGTFTSSITGLTTNTTYHVRAYATNSVGTSYGNDQPFTTSSGTGSFTDPTVNGGFESGNVSGWNNSWGSIGTTSPQSGTYCLSFFNGGSCDQTVSGLTPNTTYTLHGWGKVQSGNSVAIGVKNFGGTETNTSVTATSWIQGNVTFTTGSSSTSATIYAFQNGGSGTVWADSYSITKN